jgi:hypothetical protein
MTKDYKYYAREKTQRISITGIYKTGGIGTIKCE